ncbi:dethiobiotin synthase [Winogradskyella sp. PG-2]|uniref:dethiobiotin synthase n=1 Tax=Winogradskyella sp. PG-2 TaxID=754409 RepID=UPI0004587CCF|nr:dethiobiotin synthase [Winogradskyella sp. PG-2]BAO75786.1 dethiobiotin synthetase [Winogradskyella sp. PG-2]
MKTYFITGISTDVGKTIASAILVEALEADYYKPVQAGKLDNCDTKKVQRLVSNQTSVFHSNSYALETPMSPHGAAKLDGLTIDIKKIERPKIKNNLVIEGAGGLMVPLNDNETILDLIQPKDKVIVVSRHYLGSINHTLLTINILKEKGFDVALIYSGDEHKSTESIIKKMTGVKVIGRINDEPYFDKNVIKEYAERFKERL